MKPHLQRRPLLEEPFLQSVWQNRSSGKRQAPNSTSWRGAASKGRCAGKGTAESASSNLPSPFGALDSRIDRDAAGQWKTTQSFGRGGLLVPAKAADRAHSRILELQSEDESGQAA